MCGITCVLGKGNIYNHVLDSLYQLQNRGYDSAGISVFDGAIKTHKYASTNQESALDKLKRFNSVSHIGLGHSRWATHGAKTDVNSHPHHSFNDKFTLVHNGIIENFEELKALLLKNGITNKSQTDSEVIVNLVALFYEESHNVLESIKKTTSLLKGTWGISLLCIDQPNTLYCTRHGSPLLVGIENDLAIVTSEHSGFCNLLSKYIVLNNNDICILNFDGSHVTMKTEESYIQQNICNQNHDLTPGKYSHWTLKEIYEQTDSSLRAMSLGGRLLSSNKVMLGGLESHVDMLMSLNNLILLGCGTSFHAGLLGSHFSKKYVISMLFK